MSTILPIGTTVCQACRAPVAVVRRTVEVPCQCEPDGYGGWFTRDRATHTHTIPDVAWTVVDESGERHRCAA